MKGIIESITKSKSGKAWRVLINGKFYGANFDSKIDSALGKAIDFEFDDGKYGLWLKSWGPDTSTPPKPAPSPSNTIVRGNGDRWWLPYVSNQCAHAIASGHIKGVQDLRSWAIGAKAAIEAADDSEGIPF